MKDWITGSDLIKRWRISPWEFFYRFIRKGLLPYNENHQRLMPIDIIRKVYGHDASIHPEIEWNKIDLPMDEQHARGILDNLEEAHFDLGSVYGIQEGFRLAKAESISPVHADKKRKLTTVQRHKIAARTVAEEIWKTNPKITISDMGTIDQVTNACEGKIYSEKTLRNWLHDLHPNPKPGRPKKKK